MAADEWAERTWEQLTRIATALETLVQLQHQMLQLELAAPALPPETPETPPGCPHPPEQKVSFGMTNGVEEWECRQCQTRFP